MQLTTNPRKIAYFAAYLAISLVLQAIEYIFLPELPLPGVKIGLANIVVLLMLENFSVIEAGLLITVRVFVASIITGTILTPAFYFSFGGAMLSYLAIVIAYKMFRKRLSLVGIGAIGAVAHNVGQAVMVYVIIGQSSIFAYLPVLMTLAIPFGTLTGVIAQMTKDKLPDFHASHQLSVN